MKKTLGKELTDTVYGHLRQAKVLAAQGDGAGAEAVVQSAWELLPEPKLEWDCSGTVIQFITTFFRDARKYDDALRWADLFIQDNTLERNGGPALLKGSVYYASGQLNHAREWFQKAFELSGKRPFQNEDPRYLALIKNESSSSTSLKTPSHAKTLDETVHVKIKALCSEGDDALEKSWFDQAIGHYQNALDLLPEPKTKWEAATWIYTALGDAYFQKSQWDNGLSELRLALQCPDGLGNPFILLRLGQIHFERHEEKAAADHLAKAYMSGGKEIFDNEDPKYWTFITSKLKPPASGRW